MGRTEIVIGLAAILFAAFLLGWAAHWLFFKFNRVSTSNVAGLDQMASSLHEAEETRDEALAYIAQHEVELAAQVAQTEAELQAAMDGLGDARREIAELRYYIEENSA